MSRHRSYRAGMSRDAEQLLWIVVLLVASVVVWATGWGESVIAWAGDFFLDQVDKIGNTQPE